MMKKSTQNTPAKAFTPVVKATVLVNYNDPKIRIKELERAVFLAK